jgi:hypothetical protein
VQAWPPFEEAARTAIENALNMEAKRGIKYLCKPSLLLRPRGTAIENALNMEAKRGIKYLCKPSLLLRRQRAPLLRIL